MYEGVGMKDEELRLVAEGKMIGRSTVTISDHIEAVFRAIIMHLHCLTVKEEMFF